jgi:hypothetical protein
LVGLVEQQQVRRVGQEQRQRRPPLARGEIPDPGGQIARRDQAE